MHALKRTFVFKNRMQAEAFLEVCSIYGESVILGSAVMFRATLDFCMWRKLINLSKIIYHETLPDIRALSSKAGLRLFREATLS